MNNQKKDRENIKDYLKKYKIVGLTRLSKKVLKRDYYYTQILIKELEREGKIKIIEKDKQVYIKLK